MIRTLLLLLSIPFIVRSQSPQATSASLISVVYDFDGLTVGQTDLPDGDFGNGDLRYEVSPNPAAASDVLVDRVVKLTCNWSSGQGVFGKATMRFIELNATSDYLNFYFFNPAGSSGPVNITIMLSEDDNGNDIFEAGADDQWSKDVTIPQSSLWQKFGIPLAAFYDANSGAGNGVFDAAYSNAAGMLFSVGFTFNKPASAGSSDVYYLDMICFSNGPMPVGGNDLELPYASGSCYLGALSGSKPEKTPTEVEGFLPGGKKISFVNWFMYYSNSGSTPDAYPGTEVQDLLNAGYRPVITWEMMFLQYARLDPVQPRLNRLLNGDFDGYIDAFANKIKSYSGTVILRIFHEFEGDWYPWSLTENGKDPEKYKAAFRHVVDRFRAVGANNVQWMWCLNAEPKPYKAYNWVVNCYPGDDYVDIVATDVYNHPDYGTPQWKSFRYTLAESYYVLTKFYPHKPLYICEVGCRERNAGENGGSQSKADWTCQMNKDLQSYFAKTKALIFFSMVKEHDWRINSSDAARNAFVSCIWNNSFYSEVADVAEVQNPLSFTAFPNPFVHDVRLRIEGLSGEAIVRLCDLFGKLIYSGKLQANSTTIDGSALSAGVYILEVSDGTLPKRKKVVKL
jgi:hypothetical protein